jgi:DNA-binding NarL/FixJ family response regulator
MTLERAYVLIVDADADHIAAAVRGCGDALPVPAVVARSGDDAARILLQLGPPAVMMIALALPDRDGLSVIESLRRVDADAAVIAWGADRDLREYAANRLARTRAKVLSRSLSPEVCRRCVDALLQESNTSRAPKALSLEDGEENWLDLAETARQRLGAVGAATYTKPCGAAEYTVSVSWMPEAPMLNFPTILSSALEEVTAGGVAKSWTDPVDDPAALRSLAIVPIRRGREVAGALCLFDCEPHAFRQDDLETLRVIAEQPTARRGVPALPMEREAADAIIRRELARVGRDRRPLSVILFATTGRENDAPAVDDILATVVRGNDLIVRWTTSEVLVVLAGADNGVAERVAERIGDVVETKAADRLVVSRAVTELAAAESFEDTIAKAAAAIRTFPSSSPSAATPRLSAPTRGHRPTASNARRRPPA